MQRMDASTRQNATLVVSMSQAAEALQERGTELTRAMDLFSMDSADSGTATSVRALAATAPTAVRPAESLAA